MQWDSQRFEGIHGDWWWFVARSHTNDLLPLVLREHLGQRLWITTFDNGSIKPDADELTSGWRSVGGAMVSPPLMDGLDVPRDELDEWYIFEDDRSPILHLERFVNYGGFNLADPRSMAASFDSTWDRSGLDWLYPIQERFWAQLNELSPLSYIAIGDNDVVVTRNESFAKTVRHAMRPADIQPPN